MGAPSPFRGASHDNREHAHAAVQVVAGLSDFPLPRDARLGGENGCNSELLLNYSRVALAALHDKIDAADDLDGAEGLSEPAQLEHRLGSTGIGRGPCGRGNSGMAH